MYLCLSLTLLFVLIDAVVVFVLDCCVDCLRSWFCLVVVKVVCLWVVCFTCFILFYYFTLCCFGSYR